MASLELHGTGTPLGDPIEMGAAAAVLALASSPRPLLASAAKSKIGHTEAAAGVMGLIHAVGGLGAGRAPALMHLSRVNPFLEPLLAAESGDSAGATAGRRWALPRQALGVPPAPSEASVTGVSSFAFQVGSAHHSHSHSLHACMAASLASREHQGSFAAVLLSG